MSQFEQLQKCVDWLAQNHVPALAGTKVKAFGRVYEVWTSPQTVVESGRVWTRPQDLLLAGSSGTVMLWLGCVALTRCVRAYPLYDPFIMQAVVRSAERAGVI